MSCLAWIVMSAVLLQCGYPCSSGTALARFCSRRESFGIFRLRLKALARNPPTQLLSGAHRSRVPRKESSSFYPAYEHNNVQPGSRLACLSYTAFNIGNLSRSAARGGGPRRPRSIPFPSTSRHGSRAAPRFATLPWKPSESRPADELKASRAWSLRG